MNNSAAILRTLIVYAICIPLAIVVGYVAVLVGNSPSYSNFILVGVLALVLSAPILLRWHHPLLVLSWNLPVTIFFLPGNPPAYLPMLSLSLGISVLQRAMNKNTCVSSRRRKSPAVVVPDAGGAGDRQVDGGHWFARAGGSGHGRQKIRLPADGNFGLFCAHRAADSARRAGLYVAMFFLGGCLNVVGDFITFVPQVVLFHLSDSPV